MIPQAFVQDLLNRVDIVEVVGRFVQLKKKGINFFGLCPFHNEKSPSFSVAPTKQFYHCFGCGAKGTAISFLMEYVGESFPDAVRELAQSVGMTVPQEANPRGGAQRVEQVARSVALGDALTVAMNFYRQQLRESQRAIQYLKGRGLSGEIAAHFALGYAPGGWTALEAVFDDYNQPELIEAGLVIDREGDDGSRKHYDRFRDRIMFPIRNSRGQIVGFGGRIIDDGEPKYLNSPETPVFQKGYELYGLFEARNAIRESGFAIVVEGYMDVVALAQLEVPNAVATLGTACTAHHVQKLVRMTDRIVFSFDGDAAGRKAAWRALEASLPFAADNKSLSFLFLPPEHDPDSFIREHGRDAFTAEIERALPLSAFLLKEVSAGHDLDSAEGRAHVLFEAKTLLKALPAAALRAQIVRELARLTHSTSEEILALAELPPSGATPVRRAPPRTARSAPMPLETHMMHALLAHPRLAADLDPAMRTLLVGDDPILEMLVSTCESSVPGVTLAGISHALEATENGEQFKAWIEEVMVQPEIDRDAAEHNLRAGILHRRDRQIKAELGKLSSSGTIDDSAKKRMADFSAEQRALKARLADMQGEYEQRRHTR